MTVLEADAQVYLDAGYRYLQGGETLMRPRLGGTVPNDRDNRTMAMWLGNGAQAAGVGVGHAKGWRLAAAAMGVEWMDRDGTSQAIPPAYTEYLGRALMAQRADPPA